MGHKKELQEYLDAMNAWYNAKFRNELYGYAASYCSGAANTLTEKNNHIYDIVAELLDTLVKIFDKYGKIKTNAVEIKGEKELPLPGLWWIPPPLSGRWRPGWRTTRSFR